MVYEIGRVTKVSKDLVDCDAVCRDLTITAFDKELVLYREDDQYLYLPRKYAVPTLSFITPSILPNHFSSIERVCESTVTLRPKQEEFIEWFLDGEDRTISLPCATGKTVLTIHSTAISAQLPCLIVVPTEVLAEQWRKEILLHTDTEPSEIGWVQGETARYEGKLWVIAMVQTISRKNYPSSFYRGFRRVVFDEVHLMATEVYGVVLHQFWGQRIALSATWLRRDGFHASYLNHVGPLRESPDNTALVPQCIFFETGVETPDPQVNDPILRKTILVSRLHRIKRRRALIQQITAMAADMGRKVLILGGLRREIEDLYRACPLEGKGMALGGAKSKKAKRERDDIIATSSILFATEKLLGTGFSREDFDTLLYLYPGGNMGPFEQAGGRVLRRQPGKKTPVIVVFVDKVVSKGQDGKPVVNDWGEEEVPGWQRSLDQMRVAAEEFGWEVSSGKAAYLQGDGTSGGKRTRQRRAHP